MTQLIPGDLPTFKKIKIMKTTLKIIFAVAFLVSNYLTHAQTDNSRKDNAGWPISKEVQKFSNKNWLRGKSGLTIESIGQPDIAISKRVQTIGRPVSAWSSQKKGNVVSKGYSSWIISKGVQRLNR